MANKKKRNSTSQDTPDQNEKHEPEAGKSFWTTLPGILTGLAAVITAIGALVTALISTGVFDASPTETPPPVATTSVPTHTSTWTITPEPSETHTPSPTSTYTATPSVTPTFSPGADFLADCIHSSIWQPYELLPERDPSGCWDFSPWGFFTQTGGLRIAHQETRDNNRVGFYKQLASGLISGAEIEFNLRIDGITTRDDLDEILMLGIIPDNPANPDEGRFLYFFVGGGSMNIARQQPGEAYRIWRLDQPFGKEYKVNLSLQSGMLTMFVDGEPVFDPMNLPNERAFWIGYKLWSDATIDAFISNLKIEEN